MWIKIIWQLQLIKLQCSWNKQKSITGNFEHQYVSQKKEIKGIFIHLSKVLIFWNLEAKFKSLPERIKFNKLLMLHILWERTCRSFVCLCVFCVEWSMSNRDFKWQTFSKFQKAFKICILINKPVSLEATLRKKKEEETVWGENRHAMGDSIARPFWSYFSTDLQ